MRVRDLFMNQGEVGPVDLYLLTIGRHYRISDAAKIIVSRNERENNELEKYRLTADYILLPEFKGPAVYVKGRLTDSDMELIGSIMLRYGKAGDISPAVGIYNRDDLIKKMSVDVTVSDEHLEKLRI